MGADVGQALTPAQQKVQHVIRAGDRIHLKTPGGAGFGTPTCRDEALIRRDEKAGYA